jgi:predicted RNA-binding protein with PUA-like domain
MRDEMEPGDEVLFYHSSCEEPGVAGIGVVNQRAIPDPSAFDTKSPYFDPKSQIENPTWMCVTLKFKKKFFKVLPLSKIRRNRALKDMLLLRPGQSLSVQPVIKKHYDTIIGE